MKPSDLKEEQWIKIQINTEITDDGGTDEKLQATGAIGFHVYYSSLICFAINHDQPANDVSIGLEITTDPDLCDRIYKKWENSPNVIITRGR
jgi:hypothetical protein